MLDKKEDLVMKETMKRSFQSDSIPRKIDIAKKQKGHCNWSIVK
jgi:hypothetical protein